MTAHQLARCLMDGPDLPVVINGWSSDEGFTYEVTLLKEVPFTLGEATEPTPCIMLDYHQS